MFCDRSGAMWNTCRWPAHLWALIINPWGEIMAEAETDDDIADPGANDDVIFADIDFDAVQRARRAIPSLSNTRPYEV